MEFERINTHDDVHGGSAADDGLRARRKRATRDALGESALQLFAARGFDAVAVEEIAAAAGVSRRTFFRYFPSKEAAFFAEQERRLDDFRATLRAQADQDAPTVSIRRAALQMAAVYETERSSVLREHRMMIASTSLHAYDAQLDGRWEAALRDALLADGADPLDAVTSAGAVLGVMRAVLRDWFESEGAFDLRVRGIDILQRLSPLLDAVATRTRSARDAAPPSPS